MMAYYISLIDIRGIFTGPLQHRDALNAQLLISREQISSLLAAMTSLSTPLIIK